MTPHLKVLGVGDLVWAKMRGYTEWPAQVVTSPDETERRRQRYIYFFGSRNCAWISSEHIYPYVEFVEEFSKKSKAKLFQTAVSEIAEVHRDMQEKKALSKRLAKEKKAQAKEAAKRAPKASTKRSGRTTSRHGEGCSGINVNVKDMKILKIVLKRCDANPGT